MLQDFGRAGVAFRGKVANLFEQRQVDVGFDVALGAGIAIPIPGAADIAALFDDPNISDAGLAQARAGQQPTEPSANDHHVHVVVHGGT